MKYIFLFVILGTGLLTLGEQLGGFGWLFAWLGVDFLIVAAAYLKLGYKIFGKRSTDGQLAIPSVVLLFPYLLFCWGFWHLQRRFLQEDCYNYIAPGLWMGRRAFVDELPADISLLVDLTAEFPEPKAALVGKDYLCLPTLDAHVPDEEEFRALVQKIADWPGNVYIHCAIGHGRSATVAAAVLMTQGLATNAQEAEAMLKKARPWIKLNQAQRKLLESMVF
ncbi:dual specificity protein phosphatase family protein [Oscillatoria sp. HE19RPO]|uniref:dual specificity protein phosphatase family protein n=1 Tax=Oscillatoria sp. HE19RPO TaxID=2954806 RepID=UPI0020C2970A|nr:dual specificity protein phosphatase family protein [Oscillatoria sp. HE19RPO]